MSDVAAKPILEIEEEPFIPYLDESKFAPYLLPVVEPYKARMGFLPNALKLHAYRPEIAETLWRLNSLVMRDPSSTLPQSLKRRLSAIASATNGCKYCTAHCCSMLKAETTALSEGWGMAEEDVMALVEGDLKPADEFESVCFDFVRAASADAANMPDEIYDRLKERLTSEQIVELANVVGFWKYYNAVHDSLRIPVEKHLIPDTKYVVR